MSGNYQMTLDDVLEAQSMLVAMGQNEVDDQHYHFIEPDGSTGTMYRDRCGFYLEDLAEYQLGPAIFDSVNMNFGSPKRLFVSSVVALAFDGLRWHGDPAHYLFMYPEKVASKVVAA